MAGPRTKKEDLKTRLVAAGTDLIRDQGLKGLRARDIADSLNQLPQQQSDARRQLNEVERRVGAQSSNTPLAQAQNLGLQAESARLKALVDEKSAIVSGWVDRGKLAPVDPQHLIFMIWATTQHYADFATQVEAVTGATLQDAAFFEQTVDNVQRMIIEGIRVR